MTISFAEYITSKSPVLYLKLDDATPVTAIDESVNENDGSYYGGIVCQRTPLLAEGYSILLDGSGDYLDIPHISAYNSNSQTILGVFKAPASAPSDAKGLSYKAPDTGYNKEFSVAIQGGGSGKILASFSDGVSVATNLYTAGDICDGNVHLYAVVKEYDVGGDTFKLYFDGSLVDSATVGYNAHQNMEKITLGRASSSSTAVRYFAGYMDDFAIINSSLSLEEIAALYSGMAVESGGGSAGGAQPVVMFLGL